MGSDDIKEHLGSYYPGEVFKRRAKVRDDLGYTHRVMQSPARVVIITTDADEDFEICGQVEVAEVPASLFLKDSKRPWQPLGPLQGLVFDHQNVDGIDNWAITPEYLWVKEQVFSDGSGINVLLERYGFESLMESIFESSQGPDQTNTLLVSLGAKRINIPREFWCENGS